MVSIFPPIQDPTHVPKNNGTITQTTYVNKDILNIMLTSFFFFMCLTITGNISIINYSQILFFSLALDILLSLTRYGPEYINSATYNILTAVILRSAIISALSLAMLLVMPTLMTLLANNIPIVAYALNSNNMSPLIKTLPVIVFDQSMRIIVPDIEYIHVNNTQGKHSDEDPKLQHFSELPGAESLQMGN